MTPADVLIWLAVAVICGLIGRAIGRGKGRATEGFWFGLVLGVIGIIVAACLPRDREMMIQQAQKQYEIQAEAARRAGVSYPNPGPDAPPQWPGQ